MCSPARAFFLGTIALFFHFCTFPSVLAPVPLVQRQLIFESQQARDLPGVIDGPEMEDGGGNEQVLADTNPVCCTVTESLIVKTFVTCEGVTSETICDGTLYECPIHANKLETLDIPKKCLRSLQQSPSNILDGAIKALPFPLLICTLAGALLDRGPRYNCFEGWG